MPVKIVNRTKRLVLLRLNSGTMLHLPPRTISSELMDVEVNGNRKVQKLMDLHVIALRRVEKTEQAPAVTTAGTLNPQRQKSRFWLPKGDH